MSKSDKIQSLLITHLLKHGHIELILPDGVTVEIGVTQEKADGELEIADDYCWVMASREGRTAVLDAYNLGVRVPEKSDIVVFEDTYVGCDGESVRRLDVV